MACKGSAQKTKMKQSLKNLAKLLKDERGEKGQTQCSESLIGMRMK